jgi:hypothetical protein
MENTMSIVSLLKILMALVFSPLISSIEAFEKKETKVLSAVNFCAAHHDPDKTKRRIATNFMWADFKTSY